MKKYLIYRIVFSRLMLKEKLKMLRFPCIYDIS